MPNGREEGEAAIEFIFNGFQSGFLRLFVGRKGVSEEVGLTDGGTEGVKFSFINIPRRQQIESCLNHTLTFFFGLMEKLGFICRWEICG